jgi:hypothetical protein
LIYDLLYCMIFVFITGWLALRGLNKRMIN